MSVYLQQFYPAFRKTPWLVDRIWDSKAVLRFFAGLGIKTNPRQLGALTVSMLQGENGSQKKELLKLLSWLKKDPPPDVINLPNSLLIGLAEPLRAALQRPICCTLQGEDLFLNGLGEPYRSPGTGIDAPKRSHSWMGSHPSAVTAQNSCRNCWASTRTEWHLIPLGVRAEDYGNHRSPRAGTFRVGYLSRIAPEKGLHVLCQSLSAFEAEKRRLVHSS